MSPYVYILAMALTTYLIPVLPMTVFRKPIRSRFIRSFLYYVPYACLTAMTLPSILFATDTRVGALIGLITAVVMALWGKSLLLVSLAGCAAVFVAERLIFVLF